MKPRAVTVIVPVYGDWPSLQHCIESLKSYVHKPNRVLLVNDCGPEADIIEANIRMSIADDSRFEYARNPKNLGFVGNCNRAVLELDKTANDILLLNSDTVVTRGFLDDMVTVMYSRKNIAVVSPRSNNATLATIPLRSASHKGIDPDESYRIYEKIRLKLPVNHEVPVAHGFCMLIRRDLIKKFGLFDRIFGKGYGEEVDFCMRLKKAGYECVLANRAFVYHLEARSFTLETKQKLLEKNNQIIWQRYPGYRQSVRDYMSKAIEEETSIEESVGLDTREHISTPRQILQRNRKLYRFIKKVKNTIFRAG